MNEATRDGDRPKPSSTHTYIHTLSKSDDVISGQGFDVIVDDGGHTNLQIKNTFDVLFPQALNPGGRTP